MRKKGSVAASADMCERTSADIEILFGWGGQIAKNPWLPEAVQPSHEGNIENTSFASEFGALTFAKSRVYWAQEFLVFAAT